MKVKAPFYVEIVNPRKKCSIVWLRGIRMIRYPAAGWQNYYGWPLQLFFWWKGKGTNA